MASLKIRIMGGISIYKDNERLDDKLSLKGMSILALLMMSEKKRINKRRLSTLLWPDSDDEASKYNLRYNLWNIKKLIPKSSSGDLIMADKNDIFINPDYQYFSDIETIKGYCSEEDDTLERLEYLKSLFKGDVLEGVLFKGAPEIMDLILMERMQCQNLQTRILEQLYKRYDEIEDHTSCIYTLFELQLIDPFNEKTACLIMQHMKKQGQYAKAVSFYKDFSSNLRRDLNVSPCEALTSFYEELTEKAKHPESERCGHKQQSRAVVLDTFCLEGIDYFWMSECINQIFAHIGEKLDEISDQILAHLAYISPGIHRYLENRGHMLKKSSDHVLRVQLLNAFYEFLRIAASYQSFTIKIADYRQIDNPSKSALTLVEKRPIDGLSFVKSVDIP